MRAAAGALTSPSTAGPIRVVGTAGHVDHGKSTLIRALTGIDPDRLREERERGMTIDLGFAWLTLPGGTEVGFVDVPGHQDFIRNMLAGVGSIDAVILVVALDESVMPQTREHLAILSLLGVERGVVALSKRDLVDDEWAALAREEVRGSLAGTPLETAPLVEVSAARRRGLDELVAALEGVLGEAPARRDLGRPRLPIDRVFTMAGFGTVVTGTLVGGSLAVGDEVEIVPGGRRARIRGLQTHKRALEVALPGSRVAANLTGVDKGELARGLAVVRPGAVTETSVLSLRATLLPSASAPLAHDAAVKVHLGTAEALARVSVLDADEVVPGETRWIQLRLATPVAAVIGDRLVLRRPSPSETLGGGVVTDTSGERLRRRGDAVVSLERRSAPTPRARLLAALDEPRSADEVGERSGLGTAELQTALAALLAEGEVVGLADAYLARDAFEALTVRIERALAMAHRRSPLRPGAPREELRAALGLAPKRWNALVERLVGAARVAERGTSLALPGHEPRLASDDEERWRRARVALAADPARPPSLATLEADFGIGRELVAALAERGDLIRVGTEAAFLPEAVTRFGEAVIGEIASAGRITVARARDLGGSSRRHVLPLLGLLDELGLTRRSGDDRILVLSPEAARARLARAIRREGSA